MFDRKILAFTRVSSVKQSNSNQITEISSFLQDRDIKVEYISMTGSTFKGSHPTMIRTINNLAANPQHGYTGMIFASIDRIGRNLDSSIRLLRRIKDLNIPVVFVRTPYVNIHTCDGWQKAIEFLIASDIEAKNLSARSKNAWIARRKIKVQ